MVQVLPVTTTDINTGLQQGPTAPAPASYTPGYTPAPTLPPVAPNLPPTNVVAPPPDTRTLISQTAKPGYIQGFDTQNGFAPVYVPKGKYVAGISATNKDLTTNSLNGNTSGYTLPDGTLGTQAQADMAMASAKANADAQAKIKEEQALLNPPPTELQKQMQGFLQGQVDNAQSGVTALQDKQTALNTLNTSETATQLDDINSQLQENLAKSAALDLAYQNANLAAEGTSGDKFSLAGVQAKNYRDYTIQKNNLAAQTTILQGVGLALQNKFERAKTMITDAFNSKMDLLTAQNSVWKSQADYIAPMLNKEESAHLALIQEQKQKEVQSAKDLASAQTDAANYLLSNGIVNSNAMLAVNKAKTPAEVRMVLSNYTPPVQTVSKSYSGSGKSGNSQNVVTDTSLSPGAQAVIENPLLLQNYTATERGKLINEISAAGYDTNNLGTKALSDSAIKQISDTQKAIDDLSVLETSINKNIEYIGPITGFARLNPWSKANQLQADINRVKQTVGKALEGGVLRKEDEEKYKKILPTMNDTPDTVKYKLQQISTSIQKDIETYKSLQQSSGRSSNVNAPLTKKGQVSTGSTSGGNKFTISKE